MTTSPPHSSHLEYQHHVAQSHPLDDEGSGLQVCSSRALLAAADTLIGSDSKPFEVTVEEVPVPQILNPYVHPFEELPPPSLTFALTSNDVIVKVTTSAICGSDLHM